MRYKETIRLIKKALKNSELYSDEEIIYMKKSLDSAKINLAKKQYIKQQRKNGFNNYSNKTI
jgi:uncharacterized protein YqeY